MLIVLLRRRLGVPALPRRAAAPSTPSAAAPRSPASPASRPSRLTIGVYVATGLLAGLAAVILAIRLDSSQPSAATGYELDTIAAVVIGGASLSGGVGRSRGTALGVLIIGVLRNGLSLMWVSPFVQMIVIGVVIALAVMLDVLRRKEA